MPVIGFIGMTHLGLVSATAYAKMGFRTLCFDTDLDLIENLQKGKPPVMEPGLAETIASNETFQVFTSNFEQIAECDVVYISLDVPTDDMGNSDLSGIIQLIQDVIPILSQTANLVILCQVPPGFTKEIEFDQTRLYYLVETLIFGQALERALFPERYIVGCAAPSKGISDPFKAVLSAFNCPILPMRYKSAELAKISINMCLVSSISVANTMAELCEKVGADWSEITPALKLDKRIGAYSYLKPGLGIAGGNLERDLATVIKLSDKHGTDTDVVKSWISNSRHRKDWASKQLRRLLDEKSEPTPTVSVWGLAYKENTHSVKNSPSLATLNQFPNQPFIAYDPQVKAEDLKTDNIEDSPSALDAINGSEILLILTPWFEFSTVPLEEISKRMIGSKTVLDPYRTLDPKKALAHGIGYITLGAVYENKMEK